MMWPTHVFVGSPVAVVVLVVWVMTALVTGLVIWSRRLTGPVTPAGLRRWRDEIRHRPDGLEREATVAWWSALNDGLLGRGFRRRCRRAARSGAALHGRIGAARRTDSGLRSAWRVRAALGPPTRRPYLPTFVGQWVLPVATGWADWVFTSSTLFTLGLFPTRDLARVAAVPTAMALVLSGRMIGAAIRERRASWAAAGMSAAVALAVTLALLQTTLRGTVPAQQWFVLVLAPVVVSVFGSMLSHVVSHELEAADHALRRAAMAGRWTRWRLVRALTEADGHRTELAAFVAARLLARPHAAANGDIPPIAERDVITLLTEIGVIVEPDLVRHGHAVLDQLTSDLDTTNRPTHLRSAA